jgi:hypothetical protein
VKRGKHEVRFENLEDPEAVEHLAEELGRLAADLYLSGLLKFSDCEPGEEEKAA